MDEVERRESGLQNLMADSLPPEPEPEPPAGEEEAARGDETPQPDKREKPPRWLEMRLKPLQAKRDELQDRVRELETENMRLRLGQQGPQAVASDDIDQRIAEMRKLARDDPDKVVELAEMIADARARKIADAQAAQLAQADVFRSEATRFTEQALQLWPEVRDPSSPLAQLANAKWEEAERLRLAGRPSPSLLANGRYMIIAEAAAELEASRRYDLGEANEKARGGAARRMANLEAGTGVPTARRITPKVARQRLFTTQNRDEALQARSVLIDELIPEQFRE